MHRRVDPPRLEIEAHCLRYGAVQVALHRRRIIPLQPRCIDRIGDGLQLWDQRRQFLLQIRKHRRQFRRPRIRLVTLQQCVVGACRIAPAIRLLPRQRQDFFQPRREAREVGVPPRLRPHLARQRRRPREVFNQPRRQLRRAVIIAAPLAHVRRAHRRLLLIRARRQVVLARLQPIAHFRRRPQPVRQPRHLPQHLRAIRRAFRRHQRFLVPRKQTRCAVVIGDLPRPLLQKVVCVHRLNVARSVPAALVFVAVAIGKSRKPGIVALSP